MRTTQIRQFRSDAVSYTNGAKISFAHGWENFDPATDNYSVQVWAICTTAQAGYVIGDRIMLNHRRATISADANNFFVKVGANGIQSGNDNPTNNDFTLNIDRWEIYVMGIWHK